MKGLFAMLALVASALLPNLARGEPQGARSQVLHMPVREHKAEQGILTPIPIRIELPDSVTAQRVLVSYRLFGLKEWTTLELGRQSAQVFLGAIPCLQVSTVTGDVLYYIRAHDFEGAVVAYSGSRHEPYRVRIIHDTVRQDLASSPARCPIPLIAPRVCRAAPVSASVGSLARQTATAKSP